MVIIIHTNNKQEEGFTKVLKPDNGQPVKSRRHLIRPRGGHILLAGKARRARACPVSHWFSFFSAL